MTTILNSTYYAQLNADMATLFKTGLYSGVAITLFTDEAGTSPFVYNGITIQNKKVTKVTKTAAYTDKKTGEIIKAHVDVYFDDGAWSICTDEVDDVWYSLNGIPVQRRRF
jgi:hypothetical protein|tara:strand:+ start:2296 stop:2628 length:333 start_codon:yes stop_codon:yes gene_type:complete